MREQQTGQIQGLYEFGVFRLDAGEGVLYATGVPVKLTPKAVQTLTLLVERSGHIVSKAEFFEKVWAQAFVEDAVLSFNISQLRKTLARFDLGTNFIETVPRRGFRFMAVVREISSDISSQTEEIIWEKHSVEKVLVEETIEMDLAPATLEIPTRAIAALPAKTSKRFYPVAALGVLLMCLTVGAGFYFRGGAGGDKRLALPAIKSLAVLPLKSFAAKNEDEELRLRITDALITKFGNLHEVSVRPTDSVLRFVGADTDAREAGKQLEVDAVLDGRVQTEGDKVRVTLQLISVQTGAQIWAGQFDGKMNEILDLQDDISAQLLPRFARATVLAKNPTTNAAAYENYLKGRYLWNKREPAEMKKAVVYFEQAVALDPNFALAYSGLADTYSMLTNFDRLPRFEGYAKAKKMAEKALKIDPNLSEAYAALGWILYEHEWNWEEAEKAFARAIELNANNAEAHHWRALNFIAVGKNREYLAEMETARSLAPLTKPIAQNYYRVVFMKEGCEKAFEYLEKFQTLHGISASDQASTSGLHYVRCGSYLQAIAILEQIPREELTATAQAYLGVAYAKTGKRKEALVILESLKKSNSSSRLFRMPYIYVALGDFDSAFANLEKGIELQDDRFTRLKYDEFLAPLHSDARFKQLLKKMNLPV